MSVDLSTLFQQTVRRQPTHPAILGPKDDQTITYEELDRAIEHTAERLRRAGLGAGDCVGLHYPSGSRYIVLNYAVWRCGACVVPVAMELASQEKQEICREIALDFLISVRGKATFAEPFRRNGEHAISDTATLTPLQSPRSRPAEFDRLGAAFIRFTSGTTGTSKGVVLSHETIRDRIEAANEALRIGPEDRVLWLLSMAYHFTVSIVGYLSFGATIVLPVNHFATAVVTACRRHRATMIYASPAHWALLADYADASPLPSLRLAISTTSALDRQVARRFHQRYGLPLTQALGIIEIGLPAINVDFATEKTDSVGRVLPAYELRLEDAGLDGSLYEISFRGKGMLDAYYHPWRTRDQIMPDGWFATGDIGELDADGCLFLRGRRTDVISVMGMKFFPQEVETVLASHPAVAEAAVFAQGDRRQGEIPCARVVCNPGVASEGLEEELRRWCAERLASYKVPERIEVADSLERTASGKLLHRPVAGGAT
jgi:long-chain acyl-CoA synthetase